MTANGVPVVSVVSVSNLALVPQINELRVLLAPPFITPCSFTELALSKLLRFEIITGINVKTLVRAVDFVRPAALLA